MGRWAVWRRERGSDACAGVPVGSALARGGCGSTRARVAAARAHVLKAAAECVWHETVVQVLMLLHTVAEMHSACGSIVSGRDSSVWRSVPCPQYCTHSTDHRTLLCTDHTVLTGHRYGWMRASCRAMHALLPPVLGCWNRGRVHAPVRPAFEPSAVALTNSWARQLGRWQTAPPPHSLAPSRSALPSDAELDYRDWVLTVAQQPPSPAAGEGQSFHTEADASELPRSRARPRRAMPLERMPPIRSRLREPKMLQPLPEERRFAVEQARRDGAEVRAARQEEADLLRDELVAAKAVKAAIAAERADLCRGMQPDAVLFESQLIVLRGLHRDSVGPHTAKLLSQSCPLKASLPPNHTALPAGRSRPERVSAATSRAHRTRSRCRCSRRCRCCRRSREEPPRGEARPASTPHR